MSTEGSTYKHQLSVFLILLILTNSLPFTVYSYLCYSMWNAFCQDFCISIYQNSPNVNINSPNLQLLALIGRDSKLSCKGSLMTFSPRINFAPRNAINVKMSSSNCWNKALFLRLLLLPEIFPRMKTVSIIATVKITQLPKTWALLFNILPSNFPFKIATPTDLSTCSFT